MQKLFRYDQMSWKCCGSSFAKRPDSGREHDEILIFITWFSPNVPNKNCNYLQ